MRQLSSVARPAVRTAVLIGLTAFSVAACGGGNDNQNSSATSSAAAVSSSTMTSSASSASASSMSSTAASSTSAATTSSGGADSTQAAAQIKQNWTAFFAGSTPAEQKVALLQNGQQFAPFIQQMAQSPLAQGTSAQVNNVTVNGQTATVTYSILVAGQPALTDQTGQAVLVDGTWKVGDSSFCSLLALQGGTPPLCASASSSAPTS